MSNTTGVRVINWLVERQALLPMPRHQQEHLSREIDSLLDWPDSKKAIASLTAPQGSERLPTDYGRLSVMLYRCLERLSLAIEGCAKIGFEESSPIKNAHHASIWNDLNDAQKDAKLKLKHYQRFIVDKIAAPPASQGSELSAKWKKTSSGSSTGQFDEGANYQAGVCAAEFDTWLADRVEKLKGLPMVACNPYSKVMHIERDAAIAILTGEKS